MFKPHQVIPFWMIALLLGAFCIIAIIFLINQKLKSIIKERSEELARSMVMSYIGIHTSEIVHNLNNSLTPILITAELLERAHPKEEGIRQIITYAQRIKNTIRLILDKNEMIQDKEGIGRFCVDEFISQEIEFNKMLPQVKNLDELVLDLQEGVYAKMSILDFQQIFSNLIDNATDAMTNSKSKKLRICSKVEGKNLVIEVSDSGSGIESENLDKIFTPHFTTKYDRNLNDVKGGTGLGLYSVKRNIEKYEGTIAVNSTVGVGTTFNIRLPVISSPDSV